MKPRRFKVPIITDWKNDLSITLSAGWGTTVGHNIWNRREGDSLHVRGYFTAGTVGASTASLSLPSGYVIDYRKSGSAQAVSYGKAENLNTGGNVSLNYHLFTDGSDTASLFFTVATGTGTFTKTNVNGFANNDYVYWIEFLVPIAGWKSNRYI